MTSETPTNILLLGPSSFYVRETPVTPLLKDQLIEKLESGGGFRCAAERLYLGGKMAGRTQQLLDRYDPDVVLLYLGSGSFEVQSVVETLRARWPGLYRPALRFSRGMKSLAGGGPQGAPGPRGWLFRLPRLVTSRFLGLGYPLTPDDAIASAIETINILCRRETVRPFVYFSAVCWPPVFKRQLEILAEFDSKVRGHCRERRVDYWYRHDEMERCGFVPRLGPDGLHANAETYAFEADLLAGRMLKDLGVAAQAVGS